MAYKDMTAAEYMTAVYESCPEVWKDMYPTLEDFLVGFAKHLVKKAKEMGALDRASVEVKDKVARFERSVA